MKLQIKLISAVVIAILLAGGFFYYQNHKYEFKPKTESNLFTLGQIAASKGDHLQAIKYYEDLLQKDPKHVIALQFLIESYVKTNNPPKVFEKLNRLIELDPSVPTLELAVSYSLQLKDKDRADKYLELLNRIKAKTQK